MVHLSHIVILNQRLQHSLRYIPNGVLMLQQCLTRITVLVNVNLQVFSVADVEEKEKVFEVAGVLDCIFEEKGVAYCGCEWG